MAENYFFPSNFTDVDLPEAKLTAADFKVTPDYNIIIVSYIVITLIDCSLQTRPPVAIGVWLYATKSGFNVFVVNAVHTDI